MKMFSFLSVFIRQIRVLFLSLRSCYKHLLLFPVLFSFFLSSWLFAQNINYARRVLDTLCSQSMHGRGYSGTESDKSKASLYGDKMAAFYICDEFKRLGLLSYMYQTYMQPFQISVNTFPGRMNIESDGVKLVPGKDFICYPFSGGSPKKKYPVLWLDSATLKSEADLNTLLRSDNTDKFIIADHSGISDSTLNRFFEEMPSNPAGAAGVAIVKNEKLTCSLAQEAFAYPVLAVLKSSVKAKAKKVTIELNQYYLKNYITQNVIGFAEGSSSPDSFIVFSAHYDHLGHMGREVYFPGANDNASGVAMLLNLAEHYIKNPPKYTTVFIAFGAEELGLLGSKYFVEHPLFPLKQIKFLVNLDIVGTGDEGITVVNGTVHTEEFNRLRGISNEKKYLAQVLPRDKAANSDHYPFSEKGVPAFFIYTLGGIKAYHDIYDRPETLPLNAFENLFKLLVDFVDW